MVLGLLMLLSARRREEAARPEPASGRPATEEIDAPTEEESGDPG